MTPAIMPVPQARQPEMDPVSLEMAETDSKNKPSTASVIAGRR